MILFKTGSRLPSISRETHREEAADTTPPAPCEFPSIERSPHMVIFTCQDTFESMMTCIYVAWSARLGHSNIKLQTEPIWSPELFCEYRHVDPDEEKVQKVIRSIREKISEKSYHDIYRAAMSDSTDKLDIIYRYMILGFVYGERTSQMLGNPAVSAVFELNRKVANEAHLFREFVRFSRLKNQVLLSIIEPKCNVLTILAPNFEDRMPSEHWMIIDKTRMISVVHPADSDYFLTPITAEELSYMEASKDRFDPYVGLWKSFFQTIGIEQRKNPRCQRNMLPLWYRKHMPEFQ